jgi:hypothetical protein
MGEEMAKQNLSVSPPRKIRSLAEREARRGKRSRSAVGLVVPQTLFTLLFPLLNRL